MFSSTQKSGRGVSRVRLSVAVAGVLGALSATACLGQHETVTSSRSSITTIVENDGTRSVRLEIVNGKVQRAEIDGAAVPDDRIEREGDTVRIKDKDGAVIYQHTLGTAGDAALPNGQPGVPRWQEQNWQGRDWQGRTMGPRAPRDRDAGQEAPKAMIGVQLVEPDPALLGHFKLEPGEATMIAAVYEGMPASAAGLGMYDLIVGIDGKDKVSTSEARKALRSATPGTAVQLKVIASGERKSVSLTPEKYDQERLERASRNIERAMEFRGGLPRNEDAIMGLLEGSGRPGEKPRRMILRFRDLNPDIAGYHAGEPGLLGEHWQGLGIDAHLQSMEEMLRDIQEFRSDARRDTPGGAALERDMDEQFKHIKDALKKARELHEQRMVPGPGGGDGGSGGGGGGGKEVPKNTGTERESFNPVIRCRYTHGTQMS